MIEPDRTSKPWIEHRADCSCLKRCGYHWVKRIHSSQVILERYMDRMGLAYKPCKRCML